MSGTGRSIGRRRGSRARQALSMTIRGLMIRAAVAAVTCWVASHEPEHLRNDYQRNDVPWSVSTWMLVGTEWLLIEIILLFGRIEHKS